MADWEYKEDIWQSPIMVHASSTHPDGTWTGSSGVGYNLDVDGDPIVWRGKNAGKSFKAAKKEAEKYMMDFPTWLGHHSRNGWEIFKISRNFLAPHTPTWCIFRRQK